MSASRGRHRRPQTSYRRRFVLASVILVVIVAAAAILLVSTSKKGSPTDSPTSIARHTSTTLAIKKRSTTARTTTTVRTTTTTTTTTTIPVPADSSVTVDVLNASGENGLAAQTSAALMQSGFGVSGVGNASSNIAAGNPSQIYYGPGGLPAAHALANSLSGPVSYVPNSSLGGNNLILWIANGLTVTSTTG